MNNPHYSQSLTTRLDEIKHLCGLARSIAQADSVELVLLQSGAWAALAEPLIASGVLARMAQDALAPRADHLAPYRMEIKRPYNSDTLSLAVPVVAADGTDLARIVLHQARPDALSSALAAQFRPVASLIAARLVAETGPDHDLPIRMLTLIEALCDRETEAGLRVVTGFLRLVAGRTPTSVEAMHLCIAGLAQPVGAGAAMPHPSGLRLTAEAGRILTAIGLMAALPMPDGSLPAAPDAAPAPALALPDAFRAIANLSLGKATFDVGESADETCLAYRAAGLAGAWSPLQAGLADGWPEISTEIMLATQDTVKEYVFTHMIHERQQDGLHTRVYSLYDLRWQIRTAPEGVQGRLETAAEWQDLPLPQTGFADHPRETAYLALLGLMPELAQAIRQGVRAWVRRMASGATVVPVFMAQSA